MGTNKRYAAHYHRLMDHRIAESVAAHGNLQSLTAEELNLSQEPITIDPRPRAVQAWVRFGQAPLRVRAVATRRTAQAVGVEFDIPGRSYRTWVWRGAVTDDVQAPGEVSVTWDAD